ncbi:hypothetical protein L1887_10650 [Cichorium endivia]|nr:hypothetical protein L1887_10650 [Cichorium endivia]
MASSSSIMKRSELVVDTMPEALRQSRYPMEECFLKYLEKGKRMMKLHHLVQEMETVIEDKDEKTQVLEGINIELLISHRKLPLFLLTSHLLYAKILDFGIRGFGIWIREEISAFSMITCGEDAIPPNNSKLQMCRPLKIQHESKKHWPPPYPVYPLGLHPAWKNSFSNTAYQIKWRHSDAKNKDIEDILILSGDHLYPMAYLNLLQIRNPSGRHNQTQRANYWEDIGTIKSFYDANLALTDEDFTFISLFENSTCFYTNGGWILSMVLFIPIRKLDINQTQTKRLSVEILIKSWVFIERNDIHEAG